jgi:hypothetical protein
MQNPLKSYYTPLGTLILNFNLLENDLMHALWLLSGINELHTSEIIIWRIQSFDGRIHLFKQLANERFKDKTTRQRIKKLAGRLEDRNKRRNDLVHGKWVSFGPLARVIRFQDRPDIAKWRIVTVTPKQIHAGAMQIIRTQIALRRFITIIQKRNDRDQRAASHGKP